MSLSDKFNQVRFWEIEKNVKDDPKMMLNTLVRYFGGVDALWFAVHEHITSLNDMDNVSAEEYNETLNQLEEAYELAVGDVVEQEFLVNED